MLLTVLHNQSLADIAIRYCGTIEALMDIAVVNKSSITDDLLPGTLLNIPNKDYGSAAVVDFFVRNKKQPATALSDADLELLGTVSLGIGSMVVENTFVVR